MSALAVIALLAAGISVPGLFLLTGVATVAFRSAGARELIAGRPYGASTSMIAAASAASSVTLCPTSRSSNSMTS